MKMLRVLLLLGLIGCGTVSADPPPGADGGGGSGGGAGAVQVGTGGAAGDPQTGGAPGVAGASGAGGGAAGSSGGSGSSTGSGGAPVCTAKHVLIVGTCNPDGSYGEGVLCGLPNGGGPYFGCLPDGGPDCVSCP